jgi:hypothetical protein
MIELQNDGIRFTAIDTTFAGYKPHQTLAILFTALRLVAPLMIAVSLFISLIIRLMICTAAFATFVTVRAVFRSLQMIFRKRPHPAAFATLFHANIRSTLACILL